jgi:2'-5' RNA ligase
MEPALPELEPLSKADASAGAMVAVPVPDDVAGALRGLVDLPDVPDVMHITLLYLGPAADINDLVQSRIDDVVREVAADMPPLDLKIAGFGTFTAGPRGTPVYAIASGPGLSRLQAELEEEISDVADLPSEHGWVPHITLGYVPDGEEVPDLPALAPGSAPQWLADSLLLAFAGEHATVPLTGRAAVTRALCPVLCAEAEKQIIWYRAAVPGDEDTYGHIITKDEVEDACHSYMRGPQGVKLEHGISLDDQAAVVENFLLPCDINIGDTYHGQKVTREMLSGDDKMVEGEYHVAILYEEQELWEDRRDSDEGVSWAGMARKVRR